MNASFLTGSMYLLVGLLAIMGSSCTTVTTETPSLRPIVEPLIIESWYERSLVGMEVGPTVISMR